jgi:cell wall-associated NlpC family hydrolase
MLDRQKLLAHAETYVSKHLPDTGYTLKAMKAVCTSVYPENTNLMVQFALQFDGKETEEDLTEWDSPERRLPYGDSRSLDKKSDCSSFVENVYDIFFGFDIGTWTEAIWKKYKDNQVQYTALKPCDLIFWNFKKDRNVSHVAMYIGDGRIIHTTSTSNPLRVDKVTYASGSRVGCVRILTNDQYNSLLYSAEDAGNEDGDNGTPESPVQYKYAGATFTNLRKTAGGTVIGRIYHNSIVNYINEVKKGSTVWWNVYHLSSGKTGWCANTNLFKKV